MWILARCLAPSCREPCGYGRNICWMRRVICSLCPAASCFLTNGIRHKVYSLRQLGRFEPQRGVRLKRSGGNLSVSRTTHWLRWNNSSAEVLLAVCPAYTGPVYTPRDQLVKKWQACLRGIVSRWCRRFRTIERVPRTPEKFIAKAAEAQRPRRIAKGLPFELDHIG